MNRQIKIILLSISAFSLAGCIEKGYRMPKRTIEQVQEEHTDEWMVIPGVEGTAIGLFKDQPCIMILSSVAPQQLRSKIPETIDGYHVAIEQTGTFRALEGQ